MHNDHHINNNEPTDVSSNRDSHIYFKRISPQQSNYLLPVQKKHNTRAPQGSTPHSHAQLEPLIPKHCALSIPIDGGLA